MVRSYIQDTDCSVYIHTKNIYLLINKIFKIRQRLLRPIMIKRLKITDENSYKLKESSERIFFWQHITQLETIWKWYILPDDCESINYSHIFKRATGKEKLKTTFSYVNWKGKLFLGNCDHIYSLFVFSIVACSCKTYLGFIVILLTK